MQVQGPFMDTGVTAGDEDWPAWMKERAEFQAWLWGMKEIGG